MPDYPHYDGVHELRFNYSVVYSNVERFHTHSVDVRLVGSPLVGTPLNTVLTASHDLNDTRSLTLVAGEYADNVMAKQLKSDGTIIGFELWRYPADGNDATFVGAAALGIPGVLGTNTDPASQSTMTFRTVGGNIMRVQLMAVSIAGRASQAFPTANANLNEAASYLTGTAHPFVARDDTRPIYALKWSLAENSKLAKKVYRP